MKYVGSGMTSAIASPCSYAHAVGGGQRQRGDGCRTSQNGRSTRVCGNRVSIPSLTERRFRFDIEVGRNSWLAKIEATQRQLPDHNVSSPQFAMPVFHHAKAS